jgi:hypothetical protein
MITVIEKSTTIVFAPYFHLKYKWRIVIKKVNINGINAGNISSESDKFPFINETKERCEPHIGQSIPSASFQEQGNIF